MVEAVTQPTAHFPFYNRFFQLRPVDDVLSTQFSGKKVAQIFCNDSNTEIICRVVVRMFRETWITALPISLVFLLSKIVHRSEFPNILKPRNHRKCGKKFDQILFASDAEIYTVKSKWMKLSPAVGVASDMPENYFAFENIHLCNRMTLSCLIEHSYMWWNIYHMKIARDMNSPHALKAVNQSRK